jgi:hypothetical protein
MNKFRRSNETPPQAAFPMYYHIGIPGAGAALFQAVFRRDERVALFPHNWFNSARFYDSPPPVPSRPLEGRVALLSDENLIRQKHCKFLITMERIASVVPDARIIITLREQRDLLLSLYQQCVAVADLACSFEEWLQTPDGLDMLSIAGYSTVYRVLNLFFSRERIHLLFFEDLKRDPENFLDDLHAIVGLDFEDRAFARSNTHLTDGALTLPRIIHRLRRLVRKAWTRRRNHESLVRWEQTALFLGLEEEFRRSNRELQSLTGANLAQRGYLD